MEIYWDESGVLTREQQDFLTKVAVTAAQLCNAHDDSEVSISFIGTDEIRELNLDYRGINDATDVLSFPIPDYLTMGPLVLLGDIVICMDVAKSQAEEYGHSLERELAFLTVHGMLHLLGYDHESKEDETEMFAMQDKVLEYLQVKR